MSLPSPTDDVPFSRVEFTGPPQWFAWDRAYRWAPPPLPDYDLWCIFDGRGQVSLRGGVYDLAPGLGFVLAPGDGPQARHDPEHPLLAFFCHFRMFDAQGRAVAVGPEGLPPPGFALRDPGRFRDLAWRCVTAHRRGHPLPVRQSRLVFEQMLALVWEWWLLPPPKPGDEEIARIVHRIEQRPGARWSVTGMARDAHLSAAQFTRRFRAYTGCPPLRYVARARMRVARQLVTESAMSLKEIAHELGFGDEHYFNRQFRRHFHGPPGALRTRAGSGPGNPPDG